MFKTKVQNINIADYDYINPNANINQDIPPNTTQIVSNVMLKLVLNATWNERRFED